MVQWFSVVSREGAGATLESGAERKLSPGEFLSISVLADFESSFPIAQMLGVCLALCAASPALDSESWHLRFGRCWVRYMGGWVAVESTFVFASEHSSVSSEHDCLTLRCLVSLAHQLACYDCYGLLKNLPFANVVYVFARRLVSAYRPVADAGSLVRGQRVAWPVGQVVGKQNKRESTSVSLSAADHPQIE